MGHLQALGVQSMAGFGQFPEVNQHAPRAVSFPNDSVPQAILSPGSAVDFSQGESLDQAGVSLSSERQVDL